MIIRRATQHDVGAICHVIHQALEHGGYEPYELANITAFYSRKRMSDAIAKTPYAVATIENRVFGVAGWDVKRTDAAELFTLYVDPRAQGAGIGQALLKHAVHDLKPKLTSPTSTIGAFAMPGSSHFYFKQGFEHQGVQPVVFGGVEIYTVPVTKFIHL